MAERQNHAVVEIEGIGEFFVVFVFQRLDSIQVKPAAQIGDALAGHRAEQPVEPVVAHHPQGAVPLNAAALHKAGAKAAVIVFVGAAPDQGQQVADIALVIAVEHHHIVKAVGRRIAERHLMAAAQTIVFVIAQQAHRRSGVSRHPAAHGILGAVGGAVVHHNALGHKVRHPGVQQLFQHPGHLLFTVVGWNKDEKPILHSSHSFLWSTAPRNSAGGVVSPCARHCTSRSTSSCFSGVKFPICRQ